MIGKGSRAALNFSLLEQLVDFEEDIVHPPVNYAVNCARMVFSHQLASANYFLESYKDILSSAQAFWGIPNTGQKEINMLNPQRQLNYLHHATIHKDYKIHNYPALNPAKSTCELLLFLLPCA